MAVSFCNSLGGPTLTNRCPVLFSKHHYTWDLEMFPVKGDASLPNTKYMITRCGPGRWIYYPHSLIRHPPPRGSLIFLFLSIKFTSIRYSVYKGGGFLQRFTYPGALPHLSQSATVLLRLVDGSVSETLTKQMNLESIPLKYPSVATKCSRWWGIRRVSTCLSKGRLVDDGMSYNLA